MYDIVSKQVFPFIKKLHADKESAFSKYMNDAIFMIPTPQMLEKIVTNIEELTMKGRDAKGDLYGYLLSKVATAGSAGFLVAAGEYIQKNNQDLFNVQELRRHYDEDMFFGYDMDRTMLRIGAMNMMLHGV